MVACVFGGAPPTTPNPKETLVDRDVFPPSAVQCDAVLSHASSRCDRPSRSTYKRTRLKSEAARILVSETAFAALRASPLNRKLARVLPNIGTAMALTRPMSATTNSISSSEKPDCVRSLTIFTITVSARDVPVDTTAHQSVNASPNSHLPPVHRKNGIGR